MNVLADFEDNLDRLYVIIEYHERIRGAALSLLSVTAGDAPEPTPAVMDSLLALVFLDGASFDPAGGSVDALLASGRLGIIENEELQVLLASWHGAVEDSSEDEAWIFGDVA